MATLADMEYRTFELLQDVASGSSVSAPGEGATYARSRVQSFLLEGARKCAERFGFLKTTVAVPTVTAQATYGLVSAVHSGYRRVLRIERPDGLQVPIVPFRQFDSHRSNWRTEAGTPYYAIMDMDSSTTMRLQPIPTAVETLQITVEYAPIVTGDVTALHERFHDDLPFYAAGRLLLASKDPADRSQGQEYLAMWKAAVGQAWASKMNEGSARVPYRDF